MKTNIIAFIVLAAVIAAGCSAEGLPENTAGEEGSISEVLFPMLDDMDMQVDKLMAIALPLFEYEGISASKLLVQNALEKISDFNQKAAKAEEKLAEISEYEFIGKEKYISSNREIIGHLKELMAIADELYSMDLDLKAKDALEQKKDRTDELHNAIVNCRCNEVDCEQYSSLSLEYLEGSVKIFRRVESKYDLELYGKIADEWESDLNTAKKHWPSLIKDAKRYGERCYRINDAYSRYLADIDSAERATEEEIGDALSQKWLLKMVNIASMLDETAVELDSARGGIEA